MIMILSLLKPQILINFYSKKLYDLDDIYQNDQKESKSSKQQAASQPASP